MNFEYPKSVIITEVGARDGLQNENTILSVETKIKFIDKLVDAISDETEIEVGAFVHPKVKAMAGSDELAKHFTNELSKSSIGKNQVKFSALVPNEKGLDRAFESGIKRISVFTAASEEFNKKNINMSIEESLIEIEKVLKKAQEKGLSVRGYLSTCFTCPYTGTVDKQKVLELTKKLLEIGVDEVSIGDTTGKAAPNNVVDLINALFKAGIDKDKIALHFHDTDGRALANVLSALQMGIYKYDSSAGGLGGCPYAPGASGNLATEDLVSMLKHMGIKTNIDLDKLVEASLFIEKELNKKLPSKILDTKR